MQIDITDIMLSTLEGGEVRVNIGDNVDGKGYGASLPYWQTDGFRSRPNLATTTGAAQGLYLTQGNLRRVIASRDNRFLGPFGDLAPGDRAVVSDCDAGLFLDQSANTIRLEGAGATVVVDGAGETVTITKGIATITVETVAGFDTIELAVGGVKLTIDVTGVNVTGVLKVGGVPLTVP